MAKDPVCAMKVDEKKAAATSTHGGVTYYFCSTKAEEACLCHGSYGFEPSFTGVCVLHFGISS